MCGRNPKRLNSMTDAPLGTARGYADLQPILRARADALGLSRETIDRIAGVPSGYASKVLAEIPMRKLGPETLGPMLGALGVMLVAMPDPEAVARYAAKGEQRVEKYALNAAMHGDTVHIKISGRKFKRGQRKGGKNSRAFVGKRKARKLGEKAAWMRWRKPKLIELTKAKISADGYPACRWTPATSRAMLRGQRMGLTLRSHTKFSPSDETRQPPSQPR